MSWRDGFGKAKKGVQQESVIISHAQRPPSADAADLNGSAMPPTPSNVYPSNMARIAAKIRQNAFRTICNFQFFDAEKKCSVKILKVGKTFFVIFGGLEELDEF